MKRYSLVFISLCLLLTSCFNDGQKIQTGGPDFQLVFLFEHDGMKVYRFFDGGSARYFVDGRGATLSNTGGKHPILDDITTVK